MNGSPDPGQDMRPSSNKQKRGKHAVQWILPFRRTKEEKSKMAKKERSTWTLLKTTKAEEHEGYSDTNCDWCSWNSPQGLERVRNWETKRDYTNNSIVKIGYNTEKSPGDLSKLAVSLILLKYLLLTLVWSTHKKWNYKNIFIPTVKTVLISLNELGHKQSFHSLSKLTISCLFFK